MYRSRHFKVLVSSITDTDPENKEKPCEGNDAECKVTRFFSYSPKSHRECMNGEYLEDKLCMSAQKTCT
jgi:hypothetical protein